MSDLCSKCGIRKATRTSLITGKGVCELCREDFKVITKKKK